MVDLIIRDRHRMSFEPNIIFRKKLSEQKINLQIKYHYYLQYDSKIEYCLSAIEMLLISGLLFTDQIAINLKL